MGRAKKGTPRELIRTERVSSRITPGSRSVIDRLMNTHGMSEADVIEMALRSLEDAPQKETAPRTGFYTAEERPVYRVDG